MKPTLPLMLLAVAIGAIGSLGGCKEKKPAEDIITTRYVPTRIQPPIAMAASESSNTVSWMGRSYQVNISRVPADSLPKVADDAGQKYVDNRVSLEIKREDGSVFFTKVFTKAAFSAYIDDAFRKYGILAGIRFDEADDSELEFSVVVALPDAVDDVFIPLELSIDRQGGVSIKRDDDMDLLDYDVDDIADADDVDD